MTGGHANMDVYLIIWVVHHCVMDAEKNLNKSFRK